MTASLDAAWELAGSPPDEWATPAQASEHGRWSPARVPGTVAGALGDAADADLDGSDWWFRGRFVRPGGASDVRWWLALDGVATVSEVYLNGELLLRSDSMFRAHEVDVTDRLAEVNELTIACRALRPRLAARRRPAARWRTRIVHEGNLRWFRTMAFGRSPGFAPGPAAVGPWRPVRLEPRGPQHPHGIALRVALDGEEGVIRADLRLVEPVAVAELVLGERRVRAIPGDDGRWFAELRVPAPARWWPHTHGEPTLHEVSLEIDGEVRHRRRIGFRSLDWAPDIATDGLDLHVNGIPVFARGAVWTPSDLIGMAPPPEELRRLLESVRDAGMNLLRVVGTGAYEPPAFHDLCDELGILVWQDLMFANLDYPLADPDFLAVAESEARQELAALAGRPSLAVVCGNSEVEQQAAMLGLDPGLGRAPFYDERVPAILGELEADCAYVPSTPSGGTLPFHVGQGIAHYFGVSGYFRPVADARRAGVRFAAECLAFANVPDEVDVPVHHPRWKAGVARDAGTGWGMGAGWDFDDVRDHYLRERFGVDPLALRRYDIERYLELSRFVTGEVMAEVIGEWRRRGSPCRGALVLWLKDMLPGAGLGVLDYRGEPKVAFHHLRRACAPVAVWPSDEGLDGILAHVANDRGEPLEATLRISTYREFEAPVDAAGRAVELAAHSGIALNVEDVLERFVDAAWAYRFGPPTQDLIVLSLEAGDRLLSQSFVMPAGRPAPTEAALCGLAATLDDMGPTPELVVSTRRFADGVRVHLPGFRPMEDAFSVEPGTSRRIGLERLPDGAGERGFVTALNVIGQTPIVRDEEQ